MIRNLRESGVEWIGHIPENWKVIVVKRAFISKKAKAEQEEPTVLSLARSGVRVRDTSNNEGQLAASYYNYNPVSVEDLLLNPMDLYSGANCAMSEVEGVISPAYANLRAKDGFYSKYYDYYFKTQYWSMALFAHGKGVSHENRWTLNNETLMNYNIPAPPYEEQKKIADFLNEKTNLIDSTIEFQKQTIKLYIEYRKSLVSKIITKGLDGYKKMKDSRIEWVGEVPEDWSIIRLKDFSEITRGTLDKNVIENEQSAFLVQYTNIYKRSEQKITDEDYLLISVTANEYANSKVVKGDILLTASSETADDIGHSTVIYDDLPNHVFGSDVLRIRIANSKMALNYKKYLFENYIYLHKFDFLCRGITRFRFSMNDFKTLKYAIPSMQEQIEIADFLDQITYQIDYAIHEKEHLINKLEEYRKSLIYEYVTGKKEVL